MFAIPISSIHIAIIIAVVFANVSVAVSYSILITVIPSINAHRMVMIFQFESQILNIQIPFQYR